ncbi:ribonuclease HII [Paenalkalicoccus suaedae]|uniref:Ribonuclease HII n=1 Tax=Paenalkalicoccus suaedae TaxID=2592382 RepID=A0A859FGX1_9BACI|nr:ribonuclease HII [Paenalkalicoccus suaedae]QKS71455.1 ribonuclease HII [Paenalkalicoccus suaedae]
MERTMAEWKSLAKTIESPEDPLLKELEQDERKGAQALRKSVHTRLTKTQKLIAQWQDMTSFEAPLWESDTYIAGIDEVGRGPLAGPVVAAAVILPKEFTLYGLTDSKKLSKTKREEFYQQIQANAISVSVGTATAKEIDELNIYQATKVAMMRAIEGLSTKPNHLLIDAMTLPIDLPQDSLIKGDQRSVSIAAASVVAKQVRDRYMEDVHNVYPYYGFQSNAGYGTKDHLQALKEFGIIENEHRKSFAPIKSFID